MRFFLIVNSKILRFFGCQSASLFTPLHAVLTVAALATTCCRISLSKLYSLLSSRDSVLFAFLIPIVPFRDPSPRVFAYQKATNCGSRSAGAVAAATTTSETTRSFVVQLRQLECPV